VAPLTALVVGNGLTIDLMAHAAPSLFDEWHPSRPLDWAVETPDGRSLRECLPSFFSVVDSCREAEPGVGDFAVIDEAVRRADGMDREAETMGWPAGREVGFKASLLDTEGRHFLGLAYTALDVTLRNKCELARWRWLEYVRGLGSSLLAVMSLNYDTTIERVLEAAYVSFFHCGVDPPAGIPLGKPHGSIDYELASNLIDLGRAPDYPIRVVIRLANAPMRRLPLADAVKPRLHVEVVPPMGATRIRDFQWVWPTFHAWKELGPHIERCVFVGVSCWPEDQAELCDVLRSMNPATEIVAANPDRRAALTLDFHARRLGRRSVRWWPDGPQP
jgi:hypothetical protein